MNQIEYCADRKDGGELMKKQKGADVRDGLVDKVRSVRTEGFWHYERVFIGLVIINIIFLEM